MDRTGLVSDGWIDNLIAWSKLQPGERALVVADAITEPEGEQLAAAMRAFGAEADTVLWAGEGRPWSETPQRIVDAAADVDVYVFLHMDVLGAEAAARFGLMQPVTERGGRALFLGFVDGDLLRGELSLPQPDLSAIADDLLAQLDGAREIHLRGAAGTDLRLRVDGRPWVTDAYGCEPGHAANFPGAEVFVAPLEDSANGVLVADVTVPYTVDGLVDAPVTLRFEHGRVTSIEGGRAAELLRRLVEEAGAGADVIAELGIGFNPTVTPRGHVMLDEKAGKTAHVAIGKNTGAYGGVNDAKIHVDCIFSLPEIEVDGRLLELPA
jgi:leucyl aminopeptidase (aminopeptidase T)